MKKIMMTLILGSLFVAASASAKPMLCGYVDAFHANDGSSTRISSPISSNGDISVEQIGANSFRIHDNQSDPSSCNVGSQGTATITYALDANNYCTLQVTDSPFLNTPVVQANCHGNLSYTGMSYDGTLSYSYTLAFSR
jgi:hypothetical protein